MPNQRKEERQEHFLDLSKQLIIVLSVPRSSESVHLFIPAHQTTMTISYQHSPLPKDQHCWPDILDSASPATIGHLDALLGPWLWHTFTSRLTVESFDIIFCCHSVYSKQGIITCAQYKGTAVISILGRWRQEDSEFHACLGYWGKGRGSRGRAWGGRERKKRKVYLHAGLW